ncbi:MAG: DMT family transporter, partial [Rhizobiaceae bacterium]
EQLGRIRPPVLWAALCLGITGLLVPYALTLTTIANNAFAMSSTPFITLILAFVFLGERISKSTIMAMIFASFGIILMIFAGLGTGTTVGNILALMVAVGFSAFAVIVRGNRDIEMTPCLLIAGVIVIFGSVLENNSGYKISANDLTLCILWGAVLSGIVHWAFILAAKHLAATELTLFTLFEFALAPIWVWFFINEKPEQMAMIGGIIVILAVAGRTMLELVRDGKYSS